MKYQFQFHTTVSDLWQVSLYSIYGTILGTTNVVFTAAMILLAVRFFSSVHILLKGLMIVGICLFTVIQPGVLYLQAKKRAKNMPDEVHLGFDDQGMHVNIEDQKSDIEWNAVRGITKKPTLLVVFSSAQHGYVLNNKVLGDQREDLYRYILSKIEK